MARKMTTARRQAFRNEAKEWDEVSDEAFAQLFDEGKRVQIRLRRPLDGRP